MGILDKIKEIETEMSRTQKNKATEGHLGLLKAKLAKYRAQLIDDATSSSGQKGEGFDVMKSGNARVAMIGFPSVGKSSLLNRVTGTHSVADSYEFTTLTCIPGKILHRGAEIQLLDLPGIIEGASGGKGRGKQVIAVARTADLVLMVLDATKSSTQREKLEHELEECGIRLNQRRPDLYIKQKKAGGITFTATCKLTYLTERIVQSILQQWKIHNAEVLVKEDCTIDQLIDVVVGNRLYLPCIYCYNKIDCITIEEVDRLAREDHSIVVSVAEGLNLDYLIETIWDYLKLLRVYTKKPGRFPDLNGAVILRSGATVDDLCRSVHRSLVGNVKGAHVWGQSVKFSPQLVSIRHILMDEDVAMLVKKN